MKIAAAYLRVSTEEQDEYSLDSQLKLIREYANKNDYIVPDELVFVDDGISGRTVRKRTAFQTMIARAKEKDRQFEAILLWKFSRFARNQEESIVYKTALRKLGVSVVSISEPLPEGPFASLIERIIEWMDEFYSIRLSGEVKRGMLEKASRGEPVSVAPFGYFLEDGKLLPSADSAVVQGVFADYASGTPMRVIAGQLADRGIRTRRGNAPDNRFVEYMLNNPAYIGKIRWSKDGRAASMRDYDNENILIYDGKHEPIIDLELWNTVQKRLEETKKKYRRYARKNEQVSYMLKGLVRCSSCGSTLVMQSTACQSLQCHSYARGVCKTSHSISVAKANNAVIAALETAVETQSFNIEAPARMTAARGTDYDKLIRSEQRKLERVKEAYENGIDTLAEYAEKKRKVLAAIARLESEAAGEQPAPVFDAAAYAKRVANVLVQVRDPSLSAHSKNDVLRSILSKIVYDKASQRLVLYFYA